MNKRIIDMDSTYKETIPIALFAYNRPNHLEQTLEGLHRNCVPLIYAFCDGPKDAAEKEKVFTVRELLRAVDWTKIIIIERETNIGLGSSIRAGVSEVLSKHDKTIVLEDDIVMRPGAYEYIVKALNFYEKYPQVMSLSLWSNPVLVPRKAKNGFFSRRTSSWGWATYRKDWMKFNMSIDSLYKSLSQEQLDEAGSYGKDLFKQVEYSKRANIWFVGFAMLHFKLGKLSFFPCESLIVNIGKDKTATNDGPGKTSYKENYSLIDKPVNLPFDFPAPYLINGVNKNFRKYFELRHPWLIRLIHRLKKWGYSIYRKLKA